MNRIETLCGNLSVGENGHLLFATYDTADLAATYGTPLYLMDEERIRQNCRTYLDAFRRHFSPASRPLFASKAASFGALYRIMREEGMGIDVVSCGEIRTAQAAGFDLSNAFFHGNNKTDADIAYAMNAGVGCFVADNTEELDAIEREAASRGIRQKILLRLTPGIDPHTYEAVCTGKVDSKFGAAIETGQAEALTVHALKLSHLDLLGYHCHVGSGVFAEDVFERAAAVMLDFSAAMQKRHGFPTRVLNLGGGYGVRYVESDPHLDIGEKIAQVAEVIHRTCRENGMTEPDILMEPGRSIVADAGLTLYTVGGVKKIPGYKTYVSVDGGMADNPRYALYRSRYTCLIANRMNEEPTVTCSLVGRCCESGDILAEGVTFPDTVKRGDLAAVCTTGAYNYSMASNYNRLPRSPVVMLTKGGPKVAVRRETFDDLIRLDCIE